MLYMALDVYFKLKKNAGEYFTWVVHIFYYGVWFLWVNLTNIFSKYKSVAVVSNKSVNFGYSVV